MKKSLIALAITSAVSAPAFAATSNVDIYGVLNMSVNYVDPDVTNKDSSTNIVSNASRIGFKGTEDLGGGLAAVWQVEAGFNGDGQSTSSSTNFASRNTFVGLKGGFGTVLLGQMDTPMKNLGRAVDNFGDTMADSRNLLGAIAGNGTNAFDLRTKNTIAYVTPDFSGFSGVVAYVADHQSGLVNGSAVNSCAAGLDCNTNEAWSVAGNYNNGPLMLGAGYEEHKVGITSNTDEKTHIWRVVGSYSFGNAKLGGQYEDSSADTQLADVGMERKAWGIFGNYAMGAVTLKANYLKVNEASSTATFNGNNTGADQWTVGADYALSKRTIAYALYAKVSNDGNTSHGGAFGLGAGAADSNTTVGNMGSAPSVFGVGLKHSF